MHKKTPTLMQTYLNALTHAHTYHIYALKHKRTDTHANTSTRKYMHTYLCKRVTHTHL